MAELDLRSNYLWAGGYPSDTTLMMSEAYRLICVFGGSREVERVRSRFHDHDSFPPIDGPSKWIRMLELSEASRLLLSLAVILRNTLDTSNDTSESYSHLVRTEVGQVRVLNKPRAKVKSLEVREACNKIIHAMNINFDFTNRSNICAGRLRPFVHLYGERETRRNTESEKWKATVNILDLSYVAICLV